MQTRLEGNWKGRPPAAAGGASCRPPPPLYPKKKEIQRVQRRLINFQSIGMTYIPILSRSEVENIFRIPYVLHELLYFVNASEMKKNNRLKGRRPPPAYLMY